MSEFTRKITLANAVHLELDQKQQFLNVCRVWTILTSTWQQQAFLFFNWMVENTSYIDFLHQGNIAASLKLISGRSWKPRNMTSDFELLMSKFRSHIAPLLTPLKSHHPLI